MAAVLKPGSSHIKFPRFPDGFPKALRPTVTGGRAHFECSEIKATGSVMLTGSHPGAAGWALGFIQVEWVDTNWLYYRGRQNNHGSIFFQRSRPPARPIKAFRDVDPETDIYYTDSPDTVTAADTFPKTLTVDHSDQPPTSTPAGRHEFADRRGQFHSRGATRVPVLHRAVGPRPRRKVSSFEELLLERALAGAFPPA